MDRKPPPETNPSDPPQPVVRYETVYQTVYQQPLKPARSTRNRWFALLLCLFCGFFGVHRFYVGKIATGVLYLFTGGLFGFGVFVDFLIILFGHFRDREGLLLSNMRMGTRES